MALHRHYRQVNSADVVGALSGGGGQGFTWRGAWAPNTNYAAYDVVAHGGDSFVVLLTHTSGATFGAGDPYDLFAAAGADGTNGTNGTDGAAGLTWRGTWTATTSYAVNDAVTLDGTSYRATIAHTSGATFDTTHWAVLAAKGEAGTNGTNATISAGTTTTTEAGTSASVTNTGTSTAATFDFTIPRGADGISPAVTTTSATVLTPSSTAASYTITTDAPLAVSVGAYIRLTPTSITSLYLVGFVTAISGTSLTFRSESWSNGIVGRTVTAWNISLTGVRGPVGSYAAPQPWSPTFLYVSGSVVSLPEGSLWLATADTSAGDKPIRVNLIANPSFEVPGDPFDGWQIYSTTNAAAGNISGALLAESPTGTGSSLRITKTAGTSTDTFAYEVAAVGIGRVGGRVTHLYRLNASIRSSMPNVYLRGTVSTSGRHPSDITTMLDMNGAVVTTTDTWQETNPTGTGGTIPAGHVRAYLTLSIVATGTSAGTFDIDRVNLQRVSATAEATSYFDGATTGATWRALANNSRSVLRSPNWMMLAPPTGLRGTLTQVSSVNGDFTFFDRTGTLAMGAI